MSSPINRDSLSAMVREGYDAQGCGVCEKQGGDVFWFSPVSCYAHSVCSEEIKAIEANLMAIINSVFKENYAANMAHVAAIQAVRTKLGGVSIKTFLEVNGSERLKSVFDSVGVAAIRTYSSRY